MTRHSVVAGAAALKIMCCMAAVAQESEPAAPDDLETVHVIGEQPGPALWKVSKGENVMWVLGTHDPLPPGVTWRSTQVEERIAESQQVLFPGGGGIQVDIGILRGLALVPSALRAGKIPDGKRLKSELQSEAALANAWARGDIGVLRELHSSPRQAPGQPADMGCTLVLMGAIAESDSSGGTRAKKLFDNMKWHSEQSEAQGRRDWINAADAALAKNPSTFAVLPMREAIRPDGYLAALRDMGYEVDEPL